MTKLIPVGFYSELIDDPDEQKGSPSIMGAVSDSAQENEDKIVSYLRNGVCLGARGGYVSDVLDATCQVPLVPHLYTDGTYLWRLDIAHYVEKYHLRLQPEFVYHMASLNWIPPAREVLDMDSLEI